MGLYGALMGRFGAGGLCESLMGLYGSFMGRYGAAMGCYGALGVTHESV